MSTFSVSIDTDSDGFLSQECPACKKRFKVKFGDGSDRPISFCPYCGHQGSGCWWTQEQADYFASVAHQKVIAPMLEESTKQLNRMSRPGDFIQIKASVDHTPAQPMPIEPDLPMQVAKFDCCGEQIKFDGQQTTLSCIICGAPLLLE